MEVKAHSTSSVRAGYKQTEVGVIPEDWETPELGDILVSMQLGGNYKNSERETNWPLVKMGNIGRGRIKFDKKEYIDSQEEPKERDRLGENDVLLNTRNTLDLVGKVAMWRNELPVAYFNSNLMRMKFDEDKVWSYPYINLILNTSQSLSRLRGIAIGTTSVAAIYGRDLVKIPIPLPPTKAEQEAIAEALSDADAWIESLEQLIQKKRRIKEGTMQELLTGKRRLPGFAGEWEEKTLGDHCELITKGTTPTSIGKNFTTSGINFLKAESISMIGIPLVDKTAFIDCETHRLLKRSQLKDGDILLSIAGVLGRVGIVNCEALPANTNQALAIIRLGDQSVWDRKFLFYFLRSRAILKQIIDVNVAAAQSNISLQNVHDLIIGTPKLLKEQTAIAKVLSNMDAEIEALEAKLAKARQIKQGMMQELLTGKTRLV